MGEGEGRGGPRRRARHGTTFAWRVPRTRADRSGCLLKLTAYGANGRRTSSDRLDAPFSIKAVRLVSPVGGETLRSGDVYAIAWESGETAKPVAATSVQCTTDDGLTWTDVTFSAGDPAGFDWTVPDVAQTATGCRIRVSLLSEKGKVLSADASPGGFSIERPPVAVAIDPVAGVTESSADLTGRVVNEGGLPMTVWFEYGPSEPYPYSTFKQSYAAAGTVPVSAALTGLPGSTSYGVRLVAECAGETFPSAVRTFRTLATPVVLATELDGAGLLQVHGQDLWWVEVYSGTVKKVPARGGSVTVVASSGVGANNAGLAVDTANVYWSDWSTIRRKSLVSGQVTTLVNNRNNVTNLCLAPGSLYFRTDTAIEKIDLSSGATTTVLPFEDPLDYQWGPLTDGGALYFADRQSVARMWIGGGAVTTLAAGLQHLQCVALGTGFVYWGDQGGVRRTPTSGGASTTLTNQYAQSMALDGTHVFFTATNGYLLDIRSVPMDGGPVVTLAARQPDSYSICADDENVYWICGGSRYDLPLGTLRRVPKTAQ